MGDVRKLPVTALAPVVQEPHPDVVDVINQMLAAAMAGDIVGLGYVCAYRDGTSTAADYVQGNAQPQQLIAGATILQHRCTRDLLDSKDE